MVGFKLRSSEVFLFTFLVFWLLVCDLYIFTYKKNVNFTVQKAITFIFSICTLTGSMLGNI